MSTKPNAATIAAATASPHLFIQVSVEAGSRHRRETRFLLARVHSGGDAGAGAVEHGSLVPDDVVEPGQSIGG
jgi:hypothetical protein